MSPGNNTPRGRNRKVNVAAERAARGQGGGREVGWEGHAALARLRDYDKDVHDLLEQR